MIAVNSSHAELSGGLEDINRTYIRLWETCINWRRSSAIYADISSHFSELDIHFSPHITFLFLWALHRVFNGQTFKCKSLPLVCNIHKYQLGLRYKKNRVSRQLYRLHSNIKAIFSGIEEKIKDILQSFYRGFAGLTKWMSIFCLWRMMKDTKQEIIKDTESFSKQ